MLFRSGTISCSDPIISLRVSRKLVSNCLKITPIIFIWYKENWLNTRSNSHKSQASYHLFHPQLRHAHSEQQQKQQHTSGHYIRQPIPDAALWTVIRFRCVWNRLSLEKLIIAGLASSLTRLFDHIQRRATVGRTPLNEWLVRRRDLYLTTHNTHNTNIQALGGIRTYDLSRRAAEDLRLRPRGHWDRR